MNKTIWCFVVCMTMLLVSHCSNDNPIQDNSSSTSASDSFNTPKYVFFFIGDGMAYPQIAVTEAAIGMSNLEPNDSLKLAKTLASVGPGTLNMSGFPVAGQASTYAEDRYITGSAAAATALACGEKTTIGTISKTGDHSSNIKTIAETAKEKGMAVGIITSVSIDHATPACYYAHENSRSNYYNIAVQMATSGFDYFGGGGAKGNQESARGSNPEVPSIMSDSGYTIVTDKTTLLAMAPGTRTWAYNANLDPSAALPHQIDEIDGDISLAEFTQAGINLLKDDPEGFFMMVEGGKIDWACHANDAVTVITDVLAFDEAIGKAIDFYNEHPDSTLIVVTGDHECGGLTIGYGGTGYASAFSILQYQTISFQKFTEKIDTLSELTGADTVTFAMAMDTLRAYFGLGNTSLNSDLALSSYDSSLFRDAYAETWSGQGSRTYGSQPENFLKYGPAYDPFTITATHVTNKKAGLAWTSYYHTALPVPVYALGQGESRFSGSYDNTDIFKKLVAICALD